MNAIATILGLALVAGAIFTSNRYQLEFRQPDNNLDEARSQYVRFDRFTGKMVICLAPRLLDLHSSYDVRENYVDAPIK